MSNKPIYLLDTNVFITSKNSYYAFEICPGFWNSLVAGFSEERIYSVDKVKSEIFNFGVEDPLKTWVKDSLPPGFFLPTDHTNTVDAYRKMMEWVQYNSQFTASAKAEFATVADGWLVAGAKACGHVVVTMEVFRPDVKNRVLIPNLCKKFNVPYINVFQMLKVLGIQFELKK